MRTCVRWDRHGRSTPTPIASAPVRAADGRSDGPPVRRRRSQRPADDRHRAPICDGIHPLRLSRAPTSRGVCRRGRGLRRAVARRHPPDGGGSRRSDHAASVPVVLASTPQGSAMATSERARAVGYPVLAARPRAGGRGCAGRSGGCRPRSRARREARRPSATTPSPRSVTSIPAHVEIRSSATRTNARPLHRARGSASSSEILGGSAVAIDAGAGRGCARPRSPRDGRSVTTTPARSSSPRRPGAFYSSR